MNFSNKENGILGTAIPRIMWGRQAIRPTHNFVQLIDLPLGTIQRLLHESGSIIQSLIRRLDTVERILQFSIH